MDDLEKLEMLRRAKEFIQNSADLSDDIKEKMLRVVDYVLENSGIQQQVFTDTMLFEDNTNDLNPVNIRFDESVNFLYITYYDAKQEYRIFINNIINNDFFATKTPRDEYFISPSKARELYRDQTIILPQEGEKVIDVEAVEEKSSTPAAEPTEPTETAPPSSTQRETQTEQNPDLEPLKKSLTALRSASETNDDNQLPAHKKSKETIRDTVSAVLQDEQQLAQLHKKGDLLIYKDGKSRQPVLLSYDKYTDNLSAIVYNHSSRIWNYFFRKENGQFTGTPIPVEKNKKLGSAASLEDVEGRYRKWVISTAEQQPESTPSTPKVEPETGTGTGTEKEKEEVPQQSSSPTTTSDGQNQLSLQEKANLLNTIREKLAKLPDDIDGHPVNLTAEFIEPAMEPLLIKTPDELKTIINAIENLDDKKLALYMKRYNDINTIIAKGSDNFEKKSHKLMKDLMISLSQYDGTGSIQDKFKDAFDALCKKYQEARQKSLGWDGLLNGLFRKAVEAIDQKVLTNPFMADTEPETQQPESTPSTPKVEPETGTGTGTEKEKEEVPQQPSSPSEKENVGQGAEQSEESVINTEGEPPSTPQPQATLKSNLEALLDEAKPFEEDHYKRLAAAIEFIQSNPDAMQKLADGETILVVDHEEKNPVSFFWRSDVNILTSTVHYPSEFNNNNHVIFVKDNKIGLVTTLPHNNDGYNLLYFDSDKIIKNIPTKFNLPNPNNSTHPSPSQEADNDQTPATLKSNLEALLKKAESSHEDHYKRLAAAIEFIQSNPDAMQKLAAKKNILVVDHEGENPVSVNLSLYDGLECTVHYRRGFQNRYISVKENSITMEAQLSHNNNNPFLSKYWDPKKIIKRTSTEDTFKLADPQNKNPVQSSQQTDNDQTQKQQTPQTTSPQNPPPPKSFTESMNDLCERIEQVPESNFYDGSKKSHIQQALEAIKKSPTTMSRLSTAWDAGANTSSYAVVTVDNALYSIVVEPTKKELCVCYHAGDDLAILNGYVDFSKQIQPFLEKYAQLNLTDKQTLLAALKTHTKDLTLYVTTKDDIDNATTIEKLLELINEESLCSTIETTFFKDVVSTLTGHPLQDWEPDKHMTNCYNREYYIEVASTSSPLQSATRDRATDLTKPPGCLTKAALLLRADKDGITPLVIATSAQTRPNISKTSKTKVLSLKLPSLDDNKKKKIALGALGVVVVAGTVAALNWGVSSLVSNPTAPSPVPTPTPSTPVVFDALKDFTDKVKDFPNQVLGLKYGATPASSDSFDILKAALANGGDAKGGEPAKAVHAALEKMAQEYNAQRPGLNLNADDMLAAYRQGREAAAADVPSRINGAFSALEKHISFKQANASLPTTNPLASLTENIKETFNNLINPGVEVASGNPGMMSDMGGYLPRQDGIFAAASQHLQHFAKATQEAVGATMHHASDAVGHAWNSEPVQSALHSSATYTVVSLVATAASVRLSAVLEARKAEAAPTDPAKNLGERALRMTNAAGEIARDFFTKGDISLQSHLDQFKKAPVQMGLLRAALIPVCAQAAIAATAIGFSSLAARGVNMAAKHHINTIEQNSMNEQQQTRLATLKKVEQASSYVAEMKYLTDATAFVAKKAEPLLTPAKQAIKETTANVQHTMSTVQHTVTGFLQGMANRFKMA